jgi:hypothetical protein
MITIEEFLYLENVKESQSRLLIKEYNGLTFTTPDQFRKFFVDNNIKLELNPPETKTDKQMLLDRFKSFKSSNDYAFVKKYIQEQVTLKKEIERIQKDPNAQITEITNLLNGITNEPVDPFFNFVIRKILTGSDTGVLPSEDLQNILSNLIKEQSKESYDEVSDVERDEFGRLIDYENLYKNKGRIRVPVLDERFIIRDFRYIVDTSFNSLPDAVSSEANVLAKTNDALTTDIAAGNDEATKNFLSNLNNLINENSNSIAGLNAKIKSLEAEIELKDQVIQTRIDREIEHEQYIDSIATDNLIKDDSLAAKDDTIKELNTKIDTTISGLEQKVANQLQNTTAAFESLSKKLEEQSAKQLSAFENAVSGLAKAVTPPTPAPSPTDSPEEKRRKEKIASIQTKWDSIKYIDTNNDDALISILTKVGVSTIGLRQKFVDLNGNLSSRVEQIYNWNTIYKQQFKSSLNVSTIKTEKDADDILSLIPQLETTKERESTTRKILYNDGTTSKSPCDGDILDKWRKDCIQARGTNASSVAEIAGLVGAKYVEWDTVDIEKKLASSNFDTIIEALGIVNDFPGKY